MDVSQISSNLVQKEFATRQLAFLSFIVAFYDTVARACVEIKRLVEKVTYVFTLLDFWIFSLSFSSFSFLFAAVTDLLLSFLAVKKLLRKRHRDGQFLS